jgi:membrane-anchored protein YejM (alkaline phosphatase superfamily)
VLFLGFLTFNHHDTPSTLLFSIAAAISTAATLYLIFYTLFRLFFRFSKMMQGILSILFFITNFALITDFIIYQVWKFHINAMVLNILTSPAAYDSLPLGSSTLIVVGVIMIVLLLGEFILFRVIKKISFKTVLHLNRRFNRTFLPLLVLTILGEKVVYGLSDVYNKEPILESVKPIPLYQPLTFVQFVQKHFGLVPVEKTATSNTIDKHSQVHYPLHPLKLDATAPSPHIFIFMFDAARESILSSEVSPNIMDFAEESLIFKNHISGGDATSFGVFSLFYALNATYWFNFINAGKEPLFFQVLKEKSYQIKIISSTDTRWPEFRQTVYSGVQKDILDSFDGSPQEKDAQSTQAFHDWIETLNPQKPSFSLVFLDAPHGYSYPEEFSKFKPNAGCEGINYLGVREKEKEKFKNSYKNAIFYNDKLFGDMLATLKSKGLYDDAIIIFTSDHGEEFYEYGFFGHNSSFSKAQVHAPFIMKMPAQAHKVIEKMTSHLDVMPTLLGYLGVKNPASDYACGSDMLAQDFNRRYAYVAKWNKNAIITDTHTYIYSNLPNEIFKSEIRNNSHYQKVSAPKRGVIEPILLKVLEENRRFIQ